MGGVIIPIYRQETERRQRDLPARSELRVTMSRTQQGDPDTPYLGHGELAGS